MFSQRTTLMVLMAMTPCGIPAITPTKTSNSLPFSRIAYGWEAKRNSLPWMAFIMMMVGGKQLSCAGFLVDSGSGNQSDFAVTAAHCTFINDAYVAPSKFLVVFGAHEVKDLEPQMVVRRVRYYATNFYNDRKDDNDIALLQLTAPVEYSSMVSPLCLPTKHTVNRILDTCFAAGWGRTEDDESSMVLKQTRMRVAPIEECFYPERDARALCARDYYNRSVPCKGDSGGPLFCEIDGRYFAIGVLSLGPNNCSGQENPGGFYARMDNYHDWIIETTKVFKKSPDQSDNEVSEGKIRFNSRLTLPGLLSLVPKEDKWKSLQGIELAAIMSGYYKRLRYY